MDCSLRWIVYTPSSMKVTKTSKTHQPIDANNNKVCNVHDIDYRAVGSAVSISAFSPHGTTGRFHKELLVLS